MASGKDSGIEALDLGFDKNNYHPPYIPTMDEIANLKSILDLIPAIHWLEEVYYSSHGITTPDVLQAQNCFMAVLDFYINTNIMSINGNLLVQQIMHLSI